MASINNQHTSASANILKSDKMVFDIYGPAFTEADMNAYIFGKYVIYAEDKDQLNDKQGYNTKLTPIGAQNLLKSQY